ncbi:hypothetical protein L917_14163 [Phytophthora nicotianae]|uniref:RxLR effector protein n=1 Tax=Phytophthora nicotianae TaxID=4792 RepID=W2KMF0_PHYNI|nr:hypothetical protein L917_14163 [Phytophthora nicotianae]
MRFHYVVLLLAVNIVASIDANSMTTETASLGPSHTVQDNGVSTIRYLRSVATGEEDEERVVVMPGLNSIKKNPVLQNVNKVSNRAKSIITSATLLKWAKQQRSPDLVFKKLKLDKTGSKLFESPAFNMWVTYTNKIFKTDADSVIFTSLSKRYGVAGLMRMTETATKVDSTKGMATKLQNIQLDDWKKLGMSSDDAFKALKLNEKVDDLLTNPNLNTWVKYVELTKKNTRLNTPMIDTFRAHFKDAALLKMFKAAQSNPKTKRMGVHLENSLINIYRLQHLKNTS